MKYFNFKTIISTLYVLAITSSIAVLIINSEKVSLGFKCACWIFVTIALWRIAKNLIDIYKNRMNINNVIKELSDAELQESMTEFKVYRQISHFNSTKKKYKYSPFEFGFVTIEANNIDIAQKLYDSFSDENKNLYSYYKVQGNALILLFQPYMYKKTHEYKHSYHKGYNRIQEIKKLIIHEALK
jgi:hypothetical protein